MKVLVNPVVVSDRLSFIDQSANLREMTTESRNVQTATSQGTVRRTKDNAYADQTATNVFNNTLGFMTMSTDEWLSLPAYDTNRPWEKRFEDKPHLRGKLESPLQTMCFALVKADGTPICRLDGNGRAGAWMAGALEKPEFVHVITVILPEGMVQADYFVSNLFDTLNGDAQKVSPEHKAIIAKMRLTALGKWVEFDSGFVKGLNKTTFSGLGSLLNKPDGQVKNLTTTDWVFANKETTFLVDSLGIQKRDINEENKNCYTASVAHCMFRTLAGYGNERGAVPCPIIQKKAYIFWSQWKEDGEEGIVKDLYLKLVGSDQSGSNGTGNVKTLILDAFNVFRESIGTEQVSACELPDFQQWETAKKEAAKAALDRQEEDNANTETPISNGETGTVEPEPAQAEDNTVAIMNMVEMCYTSGQSKGDVKELIKAEFNLDDTEADSYL